MGRNGNTRRPSRGERRRRRTEASRRARRAPDPKATPWWQRNEDRFQSTQRPSDDR